MSPSFKRQHWVPKSYLAAWVDSATPPEQEPYVWVFPRDGGPGQRRAPKNIFVETDLYTISSSDGGRDLVIEHTLASLESEFTTMATVMLQSAGLHGIGKQ